VYTISVHLRQEDQIMEINVKEARRQWSSLLDRVENGEEIVITRRGKKVAVLIPSSSGNRGLPSLAEFRSSIRISGGSLGESILTARNEERY